MPPASRHLGLVGLYVAVGWVMHCLMRSDQSGLAWPDIVFSVEPLKTSAVAGVIGVLAVPFNLRIAGGTSHPQMRRWVVGPVFGVLCALTILFLRFLLWPASWQGSRAEAWKTTVTVVGVYWMLLAPAAVLGGVAAVTLAARGKRSSHTPPG